MEQKIDSKKMWESIIDILDTTVANNDIESRFIGFLKATVMKGLADQTLEYKDGHIVSILEQGADFKIERDRFYVCVKSCLNYTVGKVYKAPADCILCADNGMLACECCLSPDCFRPATEEEIKGDFPRFKIGNIIRPKGYNEMHSVKDIIFSTEKGAEKYILDNGFIFPVKDEDVWELVEPRQENSPTFKELEKNGKDESMEFEEILVSLIRRTEKTVLTPEGLAKEFAPKLIEAVHKRIESEERLGITKKEFEEELEHLYTYADEVVYSRGYDKGTEDARKWIVEAVDVDAIVEERAETTGHCEASIRLYRDGIEDLLKKIKEG